MPQYRKKPVVIEAEQFLTKLPAGCFYGREENFNLDSCYIETLAGTMLVSHGDFVITGVMGEKYPCRSDIFNLTHDLVETV